MTTAAQAMVAATGRLREAGVDDPARDARILLAHAAKIDASRVTLIAPEDISSEISERYENMIRLREARVPVSHLIGEREFYGRRFKVSRDVLDPRPDTETLIEAALAEPFATVLDLGTGSGCILVTLLAERESSVGVGTDLSEAACLQAAANAVFNSVEKRADIFQSDWFGKIRGQYDLIVSNPPYLAEEEMAHVSPELRLHEPRMALTDEADGLTGYRVLAEMGQRFLEPQGRLLAEIGWQQGPEVVELFASAGWMNPRLLQDIDGRDRVVCAEKPH
ncbi:MAG: peptide chain release factor N(5)-glutamine methyltransferase [Ascidiaceihabitans sp.]|nr:peptide chain release factor N(5)-glutamine methyltransferase [Ascidiaceihabitans sp.]